MASLEQELSRHTVIGLDTSIFIYHLEAHPKYLPLSTVVLNGVQTGQWQGITSTVTLMEVTVKPWELERADVARQYEILLANFPNLGIKEVGRDVARLAAQLRAKYKIRPADALQVATAIVHQGTVWVSNDKRLKRLGPIIEVMILDDFVESEE
jgi:predicted nucleic acid-binding protein